MKQFCIIVVWFGNFPDYFKYWELSAAANKDHADFLIVTDQEYESEYDNIHVISMSMSDLEDKVSVCLSIKARLKKPFKSCDFRPAFGVIFREQLQGYEYWGHCDFDQVFGDLGIVAQLISENDYDKVGRSGHLTLYRNSDHINRLFQKEGALFDYIQVFETDENYAFDERTGICRIAQKQKVKYMNIVRYRADINVKKRRLEIDNAINYDEQLFLWDNGHLYRMYFADGEIKREEFIYIHFQKKHPIPANSNPKDAFVIGRDNFIDLEKALSREDFKRFNDNDPFLAEVIHSVSYYVGKIAQYIKCSPQQKKIWIAQKKIGYEKYE